MSKKIISVLLALVMVLAMGTVALVSVSADLADLPEVADGCNRYFFYLPDQWKNDYTEVAGIYWWEGTDACTTWPGYEANAADVDGVYYYDVPQDVTTIIWNNYLDGGTDKTLDIYKAAVQTKNIGCEYYDIGESENYPDGTETFDGMIYVTDMLLTEESPYSGKLTFAGEWCYYYGNGEYGFTPEKGDVVFTDQAFNWTPDATIPDDTGFASEDETTAPVEPTTVGGDVEPTTAETVPTTAEPTTAEPTTAAPAVEYGKVNVGGKEYGVTVGDTITYTYTLTTPAAIENAQATTYYDAEKLELVEGKAKEMFPVLRDITSVVYNTDIPGEVKFNATEGVEEGFDFTEGGILVTLTFKVLDNSADSAISTTIEEMVKFGEKVDYATGGQIVDAGVTYVETLTGNTPPTTEAPTTSEVVPTTTEKVEPTTTEVVPTTTEKVEPTTTEVVPTTTEKAEPTTAEKTDAPAPGTDATSATEAGTTAPKADAPATGAAAYIYVVVAVLAMAACAVVVLRKRVNG